MPRKLLVEDTLEFVHKGKIIGTFKNGNAAALNVGDVVVYDTTDATGRSVKHTTSQDDAKVAGIVVSYAADDPSYPVQVQMWGPIDTAIVKVNGTTDIAAGDTLSSYTVAGISGKATSGRAGAWGFALEAYTTNDSSGTIKAIVTALGSNRSVIAGSGTSVAADDGTAAAPSISFSADTDSGFYRIGADNIGVALNGAIEMNWTAAAVSPGANDGSTLGTTALGWSDLHLATGGVINWANGEVTITETDGNTLTISGVATRVDLDAGILELNNAVEWDTGVAVVAGEYSIGRDADGTNQMHFNVPTGATYEWSVQDTAEMTLSATNLLPGANDGNALGSAIVSWADLFLASGAVVNFANGDVTLTHVADVGLTLAIAADTGTSGLTIDTSGTSRDSVVIFSLDTTAKAAIGADETAGDLFTIASGGVLGTNNILTGSTAYVGFGQGEAGTVAATGSTVRAPDITTGGAGNIAGADLTIAAGLGTGTGDAGTVIFSLPIEAAAGDNIQTTAARMTLDMTNSSTQLTMTFPQITLINVTTGDLLIAAQGGNVAPSANDGWALGTATEGVSDVFLATGGVVDWAGGDMLITHSANDLAVSGGTLTTSGNLITSASILADGDVDLRDGGTVTQITNITTGVTLNTHSGQITTVTNPSIAAAAEATFTVTNSTVAATDVIIVNVETQFGDGLIDASVSSVGAGSFNITLTNLGAAAVSTGTAIINFGVIGGSAT